MRALVVDDERLARVALRRLLRAHEDVEVVGEAANADQAAVQLGALHPDVVFLDVEMPGRSGLQLLETAKNAPPVIFTTAYSHYAVKAFEASAVDYLVKPVAAERLASALDKVRQRVAVRGDSAAATRSVLLDDGRQQWVVPLDRIRLLESAGNRTRVHFGERTAVIYGSLRAILARLDAAMLFRASRSHAVNVRTIASLMPQPNGSWLATLTGGTRVHVSRRRARRLRELLRP